MYIKKFRWLKIIVELKKYIRIRYHDGDLMQNYSRKIFIENKIKFCIHDCRNEIFFFNSCSPFMSIPYRESYEYDFMYLFWVDIMLNKSLTTYYALCIKIDYLLKFSILYICIYTYNMREYTFCWKIYLYMHLCAYII